MANAMMLMMQMHACVMRLLLYANADAMRPGWAMMLLVPTSLVAPLFASLLLRLVLGQWYSRNC